MNFYIPVTISIEAQMKAQQANARTTQVGTGIVLHENGGNVGPIILVFSSFAFIHSLLASHAAKRFAGRLTGSRYRNGMYRITFNILSFLHTTGAIIWLNRLPDRTLYHVTAPLSWIFRAVQLVSVCFALIAAQVVGISKIGGIGNMIRLLRDERAAEEPEAQGPPMRDNKMLAAGPFRLTRHPLNLAPIGFFFFFPHMTVNRATVAVLSLVYLVLGSVHEEIRLRRTYGEAYRRYQTGGIPFYLPISVRTLFRRPPSR